VSRISFSICAEKVFPPQRLANRWLVVINAISVPTEHDSLHPGPIVAAVVLVSVSLAFQCCVIATSSLIGRIRQGLVWTIRSVAKLDGFHIAHRITTQITSAIPNMIGVCSLRLKFRKTSRRSEESAYRSRRAWQLQRLRDMQPGLSCLNFGSSFHSAILSLKSLW